MKALFLIIKIGRGNFWTLPYRRQVGHFPDMIEASRAVDRELASMDVKGAFSYKVNLTEGVDDQGQDCFVAYLTLTFGELV